MHEIDQTKRSFILGEEWIYYKIYSGVKTAEMILINNLKQKIEQLCIDEQIDRWFFIRYSDPDFHIRLRLHVTNSDNIGSIIRILNLEFIKLIELELISKIQVDTYIRELERYGGELIEESEYLFYYDSEMILNSLSIFEEQDNELRWLWGLAAIDAFLEDFNLSLTEKKYLMDRLKTSFGNEMGIDKNIKKQLSFKFQKFKKEIHKSMDREFNPNALSVMIDQKSQLTRPFVGEILKKIIQSENLYNFISNHIHMMMNRLFRTKNRQAEFVMYQMLYYFYESKIARTKYIKPS